ncbi:RNA-directed DNA polymerase, eukaryota, reverse transcriptase zinc-binding domain protein [Tanacetum coccineum]
MLGNYSFDYACSMARGLSGGIVSMWDPAVFTKENIWCNDNYVIVQGKWLNITHSYYMVNVYGPQDPIAKATMWNNLITFIQQHHERYVVFGDLNEVRDESKRFGTNFPRSKAHLFNSFVDDSGLKEMVMGGKLFTWMNKSGTKMSKLDRFLLSEEVLDDNPDLKAIILDRLWLDHSHILLHIQKTEYGPTPFKIFHSWFQRKDVDVVVKQAFVDSSQVPTDTREAIRLLHDIDRKIDSSMTSNLDKETRLQLLQEIYNIDRLESMNLLQKARIKWDVEGDENINFLHVMIKQQQRRQAIQGIMLDGMWCSDPVQVKDAFLAFYKDKFECHVPQVTCTDHSSFSTLSDSDRSELERGVSIEEIRKADDVESFVSDCFATSRLPPCTNSSFIALIPKECLRSACTSVLLNGSPTSEFSIKTGLRQGDPLSPFLFVLIMEGLHVAIRDATQANLIKGVSVDKDSKKLIMIKWENVLASFDKGGLVIKAIHGEEVGWRCIIDPGRCFDMLKALLTELESIPISIGNDEVRWGLNPDGSFSVGVTRNHIDDVILLTLPVVTSWCKILPRKVNIFIWRLRLDRLPHRLNLSRRGLDIQAIACPVCSKGMESNDRLFYSRDVALNIWRLVRIWLDVNIPMLNSHSDWESWDDTSGLLAKLSFVCR